MKKIELDQEEKNIIEAIEEGKVKPYSKKRRQKIKDELYEAARKTVSKDKRITIRISDDDLSKLKEKASATGIPYQTIIGSLIHQYAEGNIRLEI